MRVLVTNDDGPPSAEASPFILPFVCALEQSTDHELQVVIPHTQRSWIGKAHVPGETITATPFRTQHSESSWTTLNGTPASCVHVGLGHLFTAADVVIAGPNLGYNIASTFALSSGTLGAALEGAALERKAIAVSFERRSPRADEVVAEATRLSIRIIQKLLDEWDDEVAVYNVNIPLLAGVETKEVYWTEILDVSWSSGREGSAYRERLPDEIPADACGQAALANEAAHRDAPMSMLSPCQSPTSTRGGEEGAKPRIFYWDPTHGKGLWKDVHKEGSDAWAIHNGYACITPLKANYSHVRGYTGRVDLAR
ncbi:putative tubulin--tyrosine ligase pby1 [Fusarium piperis]|uniref:Tubulin--tyrosine ligase pby1 n=1 Tax=Fusarium piperis TaxID=1435070 RepID=A0A9W8TAL4_9HYPO|nr:putative tubulin--tyrosine ligase pby1 [Fusarium piperis]